MSADKPIPFMGWRPDMATIGNPGMLEALNCMPTVDGYRPFPGMSVYSDALTARCQGAGVAVDTSGNTWIYAGDATKLYRLVATTFSQAASGLNTAADGTYEFAQFRDVLLATNYDDPVQAVTIGGASFSAAFTSTYKPKFKHIAALRDFLVGGNSNDVIDGVQPWRVWWGGVNSYTDMTPANATQAGYQDLAEGGPVQKVVGGAEYALIFQPRQIQRMVYVGSPLVFDFDPVDRERGTQIPNSVIAFGRLAFFWSDEGIFVQTGTESIAVGTGKVDRWLYDQFDLTNSHRVSAAVDPINKLVLWAFPGTGNTGGTPNRILVMNWETKEFAHVDISVELIARLAKQGYTLDGLDAIGTDIDNATTFPLSFDSSYYAGGSYVLRAIDTAHKLNTFTDKNLTATLITGEIEMNPGHLTEVNLAVPLVDGGDVAVSVGTRLRMKDAVSFGSSSVVNASGECPLRAYSKYLRLRHSLSSTSTASTWTFAKGVMIEAIRAGLR